MVIDYDVILGGSIAPYITDDDIDLLLSKIQKGEVHFQLTGILYPLPPVPAYRLPVVLLFLISVNFFRIPGLTALSPKPDLP